MVTKKHLMVATVISPFTNAVINTGKLTIHQERENSDSFTFISQPNALELDH